MTGTKIGLDLADMKARCKSMREATKVEEKPKAEVKEETKAKAK